MIASSRAPAPGASPEPGSRLPLDRPSVLAFGLVVLPLLPLLFVPLIGWQLGAVTALLAVPLGFMQGIAALNHFDLGPPRRGRSYAVAALVLSPCYLLLLAVVAFLDASADWSSGLLSRAVQLG